MDRFQAPTAGDDYGDCDNCGKRWHYESMKDGLCPSCQPEKDEEKEEE